MDEGVGSASLAAPEASPPPVAERPVRTGDPRTPATRGLDALLDAGVVVLATWTVAYHACLLSGASLATAWRLDALLLVGVGGVLVAARRVTDHAPPGPGVRPPTDADVGADVGATGAHRAVRPRLRAVALGAAVVAAVALALDAPWPVVVSGWLVSAVLATGWAAGRVGSGSDDRATEPAGGAKDGEPPQRSWFALAWALPLAAFSTVTLRANPDDLYYVNLAQWVTDHGSFPLRDTIFSDQVYSMTSFPPVASYDALTGGIARVLGAHAATVTYVGVPPLATFAAVLATWRLLRTWRVRPVWVALAGAMVFLLLDGSRESYAVPGGLFLTRLWQGKTILLCVLVPLLLVYALRYVERPTWRRAGWLLLGGIAAVGLSTTAIFLVPMIAVAGCAPLLVRSRIRPALRGVVAMAAYALAAGVVTIAVGGHNGDDFAVRRAFRFEPDWIGHQIFTTGWMGLLGVLAALVGAFLLPHRGAALTTGVLVLLLGVVFVPGVTHLSYELVGLGPTLWRVSWLITLPALVGVLAAWLVRQRLGGLRTWWAGGLLGIALLLAGQPIWAPSLDVDLVRPPFWKRPPDTLPIARQVVAELGDGSIVLAEPELAITLDVMTTRIHVVAPRKYYMQSLRDEPGFHPVARSLLMDLVDPPPRRGVPRPWRVRDSLATIGVTAVCLHPAAVNRLAFLARHGYQPWLETSAYACVRR